ncbi:hypothetical protein HPP92_028819 [Vanilla planifolia]|uniref:Uncharacterized protein n=1 Tax=Vanilla planifolia TaxID=51239 RepID=A0A835P6N0_VANPL|nr:hypothetical protein HPP92_028819 [Vanilla planifolia]KAG0446491.1 hypothetical protein HPP92_028808 [Vanilla planifolia]
MAASLPFGRNACGPALLSEAVRIEPRQGGPGDGEWHHEHRGAADSGFFSRRIGTECASAGGFWKSRTELQQSLLRCWDEVSPATWKADKQNVVIGGFTVSEKSLVLEDGRRKDCGPLAWEMLHRALYRWALFGEDEHDRYGCTSDAD